MKRKYLIRALGWGAVIAVLYLLPSADAIGMSDFPKAYNGAISGVAAVAGYNCVRSLLKAFGLERKHKQVVLPDPNEVGWRVIRLNVLLKLFFFVGSAVLLGLPGLLIFLLVTEAEWTLKNFGLAMAMVPFLVIGLCGLVLPFRWLIRYNDQQVCMRSTSWRPDERCARWRDLDQIKWMSGQITLVFRDGPKLRTVEWMPGGAELLARAQAALDENRRRSE